MLKAAVIGLGWWGKQLIEAAQAYGAPVEFVRGVTFEPDGAKEFGETHKIAIGRSVEEALADKDVQAVFLATPHTTHRALVEQVAAAGKQLYCEKPFALSKADAQAMIDACKRAGITLAVGHHFRLMPSMRALGDLKRQGAFGTIMHAEGNYSHDWLANYPADSWRMRNEEARAGGMTGMGIHILDSFREFVGPMKRVAALSKRRALKLETGDTTTALVEFENGATGLMATTMKTPFAWRFAVYGENCWAESVSETRLIVRRAGQEPEVIDFPKEVHLGRNIDDFARAVLEQRPFPIDHAGILQTVGALEAVFKSADAGGQWMTV